MRIMILHISDIHADGQADGVLAGDEFVVDAIKNREYEGLDAAFAAAVGAKQGRAVSDLAREILLDEVLLPYDRLIGQFKEPDTLRGLGERARVRLATGLREDRLDDTGRTHALAVFDRLLEVVEEPDVNFSFQSAEIQRRSSDLVRNAG